MGDDLRSLGRRWKTETRAEDHELKKGRGQSLEGGRATKGKLKNWGGGLIVLKEQRSWCDASGLRPSAKKKAKVTSFCGKKKKRDGVGQKKSVKMERSRGAVEGATRNL